MPVLFIWWCKTEDKSYFCSWLSGVIAQRFVAWLRGWVGVRTWPERFIVCKKKFSRYRRSSFTQQQTSLWSFVRAGSFARLSDVLVIGVVFYFRQSPNLSLILCTGGVVGLLFTTYCLNYAFFTAPAYEKLYLTFPQKFFLAFRSQTVFVLQLQNCTFSAGFHSYTF